MWAHHIVYENLSCPLCGFTQQSKERVSWWLTVTHSEDWVYLVKPFHWKAAPLYFHFRVLTERDVGTTCPYHWQNTHFSEESAMPCQSVDCISANYKRQRKVNIHKYKLFIYPTFSPTYNSFKGCATSSFTCQIKHSVICVEYCCKYTY